MLFSRVFAAAQPRTFFSSLPTACTPPRGSNSRRNAFRINTYKSLSKQTTLTVIESHSYKKHGGRGVLWLTSSRLVVSEHSLCSHFSLFAQDSPQISSFVFKSFHTVSFSVSCKSFACHSYENCRVYTNNSHSATQFLKNYFNSGRISGGMNHLQDAGFTSHQSRVTSHLLRLTPSPSADSINSHPAEGQNYLAV